jgi:hypothetical protein
MSKGQRLISKEIDKRVVIKPNKNIKRVNEGVNGLMIFGENNDYPQIMERLINGSVTAKSTANVYASFIAGDGFENEEINNILVGLTQRGKSLTLKALLRQVANSLSRNQGSYIHCNFTMDQRIKNVHLKPFKNCRFALADDTGYSAKISVYDNWEKDKDNKYNKKQIKHFNVFNLDEKAFISQVNEAGGIENYKGQIYFLFLDNEYFYPLSNYDEVYLDCDTEAQLALYRNRQTRNGFFKKTVVRIQESLNEEVKLSLADDCRRSLGVDGDGLWIIEDEPNENGEFSDNMGFRIDQIDSDVEDELFKDWPKDLINNIRKAAKGLPAVLIDYDESKLGTTSGEALIQATNYYNAVTRTDRAATEEVFEEIFSNFDNEILRNNKNWKIKPLSLIQEQKDGITNTGGTELNQGSKSELDGQS